MRCEPPDVMMASALTLHKLRGASWCQGCTVPAGGFLGPSGIDGAAGACGHQYASRLLCESNRAPPRSPRRAASGCPQGRAGYKRWCARGLLDTATVLSICTVGAEIDRHGRPCALNGRILLANPQVPKFCVQHAAFEGQKVQETFT